MEIKWELWTSAVSLKEKAMKIFSQLEDDHEKSCPAHLQNTKTISVDICKLLRCFTAVRSSFVLVQCIVGQ